MTRRTPPWDKFKIQKRNTILRGIPFSMTFEEWWEIWQQSGHWSERGRERGKYQMARLGDRGGYEVGNVKIILSEDNRAEYTPSAEVREIISAASRSRGPISEETREKMRLATLNRPPETFANLRLTNRNRSMEHRAALGLAARNRSPETRAKLSEKAKHQPRIGSHWA
jgi:hypothetical protein